jgi:hypothetical protein
MKYTFLSKWTVLVLTVVTAGLAYWGYILFTANDPQVHGWAAAAIAAGLLVYGIAWLIAVLDAVQERRWGWTIGLFLLVPLWIGPLLYGFIGPKNTK